MLETLLAAGPFDAALRAALPPPTAALQVRVLEGWRVLALRHLAGGAAAVQAALAAQHLAPMPQPGHYTGADPWLLWSGPTEALLLTSKHTSSECLLQALRPGRESLACAVDQSAGTLVFELLGSGVDEALCRLLDASALPQHAGQASRARLMDISAVLLRLAPERLLLLVDRSHGPYAAKAFALAAPQGAGGVPFMPRNGEGVLALS